MIQDVKLGTHSYMYAISKCAFLIGICLEILSSKNWSFLQILKNCCLVKPSKFVTVTVIIGHTI